MRIYIRIVIACSAIVTLASIQFVNAQSRCVNPNSKRGVCFSIYDCPALYAVLNKPNISENDRKFLTESACTGGKGPLPHVCCNEDGGYDTKPSVEESVTPYTISSSNGKGNVLPSPPFCGLEGTGKKIYNGNNTGLDEYAWMVILEYRKGNGPKAQECGGSLINQRYVLTAAHCLTGEIINNYGKLESIRLGEYDTSSNPRDCIESDCNEPFLTVGPEEIIPHERYAPQSNDIGLIRLSQDVPHIRFIRPVCLPSTVGALRSIPGTELVVAGWGRTLQSRKSNIKQKLFVPVAAQEDCVTKYAKLTKITDEQICAGGRYAEDSCGGDSGGPLMATHNNYWVIEGIVSFGRGCGIENLPAVYTRVSAYEDWIKSKLKP